MTIAVWPSDISTSIDQAQRQIYQTTNNAGSGGQDAFTQDPSDSGSSSTNATSYPSGGQAAPTGLVLTTGTFYNDNYIDVSWTASTSTSVDEYEVELTKTGFGVQYYNRTGGTSMRLRNLEPSQQYSIRVRGIANSLSQTTAYLGPGTISTTADAVFPAQVTGVVMTAGMKTVVVRWTENQEEDVKNGQGLYEVQLDTTNLFNSINFRFVRTAGTITSFGDLVTGTTYYSRVRAIDSGGNTGPFSLITSATPTASGQDDIAANSIRANHIQANSINANHVQANSITADKLTTSELNAAIITLTSSGMLRAGTTSAPFNYMLFDRFGIRGYGGGSAAFTGGTLNFEFNVSTGGAYFRGTIDASTVTGGTIRTAASGQRVEMQNSFVDRISFLTGDSSETSPGDMRSSVVADRLFILIEAPTRTTVSRRGQVALYSRSGAGAECQAELRTVDTVNTYSSCNVGETFLDCFVTNSASRRLGVRTNSVQMLYSDGNSPFISVFSNSAQFRRGTTSQPAVYAFDTQATLQARGSANERVIAATNFAGVYYNDFDWIELQLGRTLMALGNSLHIALENNPPVQRTNFWRTTAMNGWAAKFRAADDSRHHVQYNSSIDGLDIQTFGATVWRSEARNCRFYLDNTAGHCQDYGGGNGIDMWAGNFRYTSDARIKKDIAPVTDIDYLSAIRTAPVVRYRRKADAPDAPLLFGLIAQDLPSEVTSTTKWPMDEIPGELGTYTEDRMGIGLLEMQAYLWGAGQEMLKLIDAHREKVNQIIASMVTAPNAPTPEPLP